MMFEATDITSFLEQALRDLLGTAPKAEKVVVAYLDESGDVTINYHRCTYADLQHFGQEMINEGMLQLVGMNRDRLAQIEAEAEFESSDEA